MNPELIIAHKFPEKVKCYVIEGPVNDFASTIYTYNERDAALYALGVGACARDALDTDELKYVYHQDGLQNIQVLPTFASLFSLEFLKEIVNLPGLPYDPRLLLHGQQYIEIHKPLPSKGSIQNKASVSGFHDKGKAAILEIEIDSYEKESGELLCKNRFAVYLRGAGGFSKSSPPYSFLKYPKNQTRAFKPPNSTPFTVFEESTQPPQALLYRLSGDYNPLHSDPMIAEISGFSRPILHGLCTLGFAVRAITKCICKGDPNMIKTIFGQFLLHVYPGETLITEMWLEGLRVLYQVKVKERNRAVLSGFVDLTRLSSSL